MYGAEFLTSHDLDKGGTKVTLRYEDGTEVTVMDTEPVNLMNEYRNLFEDQVDAVWWYE